MGQLLLVIKNLLNLVARMGAMVEKAAISFLKLSRI